MAVTEHQHTIRLPGILALGHLGSHVPNAIVLDVLHEQTITEDHTIDIEQQGLVHLFESALPF
jgi:hypothetical protein